MHKKFIIKSIVFILIFCITMPIMGKFLINDENMTIDGFYYEEENTLDVLFFGSSHSYCTISPNIIWEEAGIPSYNLGQPEQPIWITYHYIKEALKYQKPEVMVMDVFGVNFEEEYAPIGNSTINLDDLKMSQNKLEAINASVQPKERPYFIFNAIKNKTNWKDINKANFTENFTHQRNENKGFLESYNVYENEEPVITQTKEVINLSPKVEEYMQKIINLCKEEQIPLVLIKSPYNITEDEVKRYNRVREIAKENNIDFIDFNTMYDEIDMDFDKDMLDAGSHVNTRGARKVTEYLAKYLQNKYSLKDRTNEAMYANWNNDVETWNRKEKAFELSTTKEVSNIENLLKDDNYIVVYTQEEEDKNTLKIVNENKVIQETGNNQLTFSSDIENTKFEIKFEGGKSSIKINEEEHSNKEKDINLVVYDKYLKSVVYKAS